MNTGSFRNCETSARGGAPGFSLFSWLMRVATLHDLALLLSLGVLGGGLGIGAVAQMGALGGLKLLARGRAKE